MKKNIHKVIILVPCFNEEKRLDIIHFIKFMNKHQLIDFTFINDGSTDKTESLIKSLKQKLPHRVKIINNQKNQGKAESIRIGVLNSLKFDPNYIGFIDADLSSPLEEIDNLLRIINNNILTEFVFSSRIQLINNIIKKKITRYLSGRIFATVVSNLFKIKTYDTQCGSKIFSINICNQVFNQKFITKWMMDIEIFARLISIYGLEKTIKMSYESPVLKWIDKGGSKVKLSYFFKAPIDLLRIYYHYHR